MQAAETIGDSGIVHEITHERIDSRFTARFHSSLLSGQRSVDGSHALEDQSKAFYHLLGRLHDNSQERTPVEIVRRKFQNQLLAVDVRSREKACNLSTMIILTRIALLCREYYAYYLSSSHGNLDCF